MGWHVAGDGEIVKTCILVGKLEGKRFFLDIGGRIILK
jgi:hypothetical protein